MAKEQDKKTKKFLQNKITSLKSERDELKAELKECTTLSRNIHSIEYEIFKYSPISTVIINKNHSIAFINPAFTKLFGYVLNDMPTLEKWFLKVYPNKKYREKAVKEWTKDAKRSQSRVISPKIFRVVCKDHSEKEIKFNIMNSRDDVVVIFMEDVTPLAEYQKKLKENERKIREIFDNTNDAIIMWNYANNRLGRCIEVNNTALHMLGYTKPEMFKISPNKILPKEFQPGFKRYVNDLSTKNKIFYETIHLTKSGKSIPVEISSRIFRINDKKVILSITRDVSERIAVQKKLISSEEKFRSIVENSPIGFMMIDDNFKLIYGNKEFSKIVGYSVDEIPGLDFRIFLDNEFKAAVSERYLRRQGGFKEPAYYEIRIVRKDGSIRWIGLSSVVSKSPEGRTSTYTHILDVTERKDSLNKVKASEERFRMIMEQSPLAMQIYNPDGSIRRVNDAWYRLWNIDQNKLSLENYNILRDKDPQSQSFREAFENCLLGHSIEIPDLFFDPRKNGWGGRGRFVNSKIYPLKDDLGKVNYIVLLYEDITERKKTDEALLDSEERYRSLYENASIGIFSFNMDCNILMANPAFLNMLEYCSVEELKKEKIDRNCIFERDELNYLFKTMISFGEVQGLETQIKKKSGDKITVLLSAKAIRNKARDIEYIEGIAEDISDRKMAEQAIIRAKEEAEKSSKLKSEFLAQVSHEIRTPVNTILSFSGLLSEELADVVPDDLRPSFSMMKSAGKRMIRTIDLILNMSEIQTGTYQPIPKEIDLYEDILYNLYLEYLTSAMDKELELTIVNKTESPVIMGDIYTISEIFNNLINNAVKYTHRGKVKIIIGRAENKEIFVDITDTGIGIAEDYMPYLFEPFSQEDQGYTRKFEGNGLGLALVEKYCHLNQAKIQVESYKNKGSNFRVIFEKVKINKRVVTQ